MPNIEKERGAEEKEALQKWQYAKVALQVKVQVYSWLVLSFGQLGCQSVWLCGSLALRPSSLASVQPFVSPAVRWSSLG